MSFDNIEFEEIFSNKEYVILYFTAPKEILSQFLRKEFPEAVSAEISIEFPSEYPYANFSRTSLSPTNKNNEDYDWYDIDLTGDEISELFSLALKTIMFKNHEMEEFFTRYIYSLMEERKDFILFPNNRQILENNEAEKWLSEHDTDNTTKYIVYCYFPDEYIIAHNCYPGRIAVPGNLLNNSYENFIKEIKSLYK